MGTGFYPDWVTINGGVIKRGVPGALANDPDQAVYFNAGSAPSAYTFTNALYLPNTSPSSTLRPPFTVECWFYPSNTASEDIWAQSGFEGINAGAAGNGVGNVCGIRLVWENGTTTGFQLYTYDNSTVNNSIGFSGITGGNVSPIGNWYHLVVTCDANLNFTLWTNGVVAFSGAGVGRYSPDYWTPLTIGGG
ncbi:MAG: LamG-like jellyroll fold domain-containing protein, partial [Limisphaerales bacterium]